MTMPELLWEQGNNQCVNGKGICNSRPCNAAQDVFCCWECTFNKNCESRCKKEKLNGSDNTI